MEVLRTSGRVGVWKRELRDERRRVLFQAVLVRRGGYMADAVGVQTRWQGVRLQSGQLAQFPLVPWAGKLKLRTVTCYERADTSSLCLDAKVWDPVRR